MQKSLLHITNGDSVSDSLTESSVPGEVLPWRDVLHDGPVPGGLSLDALSDVRARFLGVPEIGGYEGVRASFAQRDALFAGLDRFDEVVLWFEHDLYDQLQMLQILHGLATIAPRHAQLSLICINRFPGIEPFYGLGQLSPPQLAGLFDSRVPLSRDQLALGREGWQAFTADDPRRLLTFLQSDLAALPFMQAGLLRFMVDYPSVENGLGQTERQILRLLAEESRKPVRLFQAWQSLEEAPFLGDWGFWQRISDMQKAPCPLIACSPEDDFRYPPGVAMDEAFLSQQLSVTDRGRDVLAARADQIQLNGLDRWYGGVHMQGKHSWRWDAERQSLQAGTVL